MQRSLQTCSENSFLAEMALHRLCAKRGSYLGSMASFAAVRASGRFAELSVIGRGNCERQKEGLELSRGVVGLLMCGPKHRSAYDQRHRAFSTAINFDPLRQFGLDPQISTLCCFHPKTVFCAEIALV